MRRHFLLTFLSLLAASEMAAGGPVVESKSEASDWWRNALIYQIYPRSFMDSNGDGVGDLQGIISKLPYLAELGVTAIWLSPIFLSPMVDFGYDIADFKAIQPEYGTMQDFEDLIAAAVALDIKIILDFVPNHSSDQCEWFQKSAAREEGFEDFYVWADAEMDENGLRKPPNNWQSVFYGSAWTWHEQRQQYYLHQFTVEQPDLNYRNPQVVAAMDDAMLFWLNKGVSGFRVDAVNHLFEAPELTDEPLSGKTDDEYSYEYTKHIHTKDLPEVYDMVRHWRELLDNYTATYGGTARIMMTEAYAELKPLMEYYENEEGAPGAHFPFNFHFITDLSAESDARDFVFSIQKWLTYMPRGQVANWVMGNHDQPRVASRFGAERVDAMNMLLLMLPGVAVTYNGEEIGMEDFREIPWENTVDPPARNAGKKDYQKVSRDPVRTPFQWNANENAGFSTAAKTWLPVHPEYQSINVAAQEVANKSHYKVYKELAKLRRQEPALRDTGSRFHIEVLNRHVFAFSRVVKGAATVVTIINVSAQQQQVDLSELVDTDTDKWLTVLATGSTSFYGIGTEICIDALPLTLAPYEGLVCMLH